ncbi:MAG TPA: CocE/NonD family hydrolase [Candidatus Limnocylindrales bacterium]|nr:CocE/NonD family hydrolase [Candidatus Limnocylindrales bacterium]
MPDQLVLHPAVGVRIVKNVRIPMPDGVRLAADLYLPDRDGERRDRDGERWDRDGERWPVVMDYIPYRKDEVNPALFRHYLELPRNGFAIARVDIRGTGASEGRAVDEYVAQEQEDGRDAVEWLAGQPWCDGHVNMMGISYGGFTALQVAALRPPHLTSIVPIDFTDDRYTDDCHYRGGLLRMYYDVGWYGTRMIAWNAMPPDPASAGEEWARVWEQHLAEDEPYFLEWLRHQTDGPYWRQGSVAGVVDRIECPAFLIGGWRDGYPNPPLRLFERLAGPKKLLIGPWDHALPDAAIPGPRIDYLREVVRWLDHWCRGIDTGIMAEPPVAIYVQEAGSLAPDRLDTPGRWRGETTWPVAGAVERILVLAPDGRLVEGPPTSEGAAEFAYDPTVGVTGGLWSGGVPFGLPGDQRPDEALSLVHTSSPLDGPLTIVGRPRVVLHISSTASVVGFAVSLADVAPDGSSHLVGKGMLNVTRRHSLTEPERLTPDEVVELAIDVDATAWRFRPGHRVRVSIASADWPNVWPTPEPATNTVRFGPAHASRLVLPVVPDEGSADAPAFEPSPVAARPAVAGLPAPRWSIARDHLSGQASATIEAPSRFRTADGTLIERDLGCVCEVDPADPARATARGWHRCRSTRGQRSVEARSDVLVESTVTDFHVTIDLVVRVGEAVHFTRRWTESIPRALL